MKRFALLLSLLLLLAPAARAQDAVASSQRHRIWVLRMDPGDDLLEEMQDGLQERHIKAGAILTAVGSLRSARVRTGDREEHDLEGPLEITSLVGTLSEDGSHLHLSAADNDANVVGGHLLGPCPVFNTVEIVLVELEDLEFTRQENPATKFMELRIHRK